MTTAVARRFGPVRAEALGFLEVFAVAGLAVAQPLFDLLGKNPDLFVSRKIDVRELVAFTVAVLVVPPAVLYLAELLVGLVVPRARPAAHATAIGVAAGVVVSESVKQATMIGRPWLLLIGIAAGIVVAVLRYRFVPVRTWLRLLAVAPVAFAVMFVVSSPVSEAVLHQDTPRAVTASVGAPHRVVWIILDEMPVTSLLDGTGAVDSELFPNFAQLAAASTWYRNSRTIAPFTLGAVPGMLTSSYPDATDGVAAVASNYPKNAFTLLGGSYQVDAVEAFTVMCPAGICDDYRHVGMFHGGLRGLVDDSIDLWRAFARPERRVVGPDLTRGLLASDPVPMATAQRFVTSLRPTRDRPRFDFAHVLIPHWPWTYVKTLQDTGEGQALHGLANNRWNSQWATRSALERHLLQVQATDTFIGQVMARLKAMNEWDDSLVVVTADHGAGFVFGQPWRGLSRSNYPQVAWTPLFMKFPGETVGRVDDRPASTVDILPTVADALDVKIPWKTAGRSLLGAPVDDGPFKVLRWKLDGDIPHRGRYNIVDGPAGFAQVVKARAADPGPDPKLRIYRTGPYGDLVGRVAADVPTDPGAPQVRLTISDPAKFENVLPLAPRAPWLTIRGSQTPAKADVPLAVAVNGVIGATVQTVAGPVETWWASLPPELFHGGKNHVAVYEIVGDPSKPRLRRVAST